MKEIKSSRETEAQRNRNGPGSRGEIVTEPKTELPKATPADWCIKPPLLVPEIHPFFCR